MRYRLPSTGSVQHPVFIIAGYNKILEELLDMNIELRQRIKVKLIFQVIYLSTYQGSH